MNHDEYLHQMQWHAFEMLGEHTLLGETYWDEGRGARWCIGRPNTFIHRCEIIAGIGGSLVVHGDFDTARFAHYGDHGDAWHRLLWMADCTDLGYYIEQKAAIGAGCSRAGVLQYRPELAEQELREQADEWEQGERDPRAVKLFREAAARYATYEHELQQFLHDGDQGWDLWEYKFGKVLDDHVVTSHAALNKCASLLREKYGSEGPPECRR